MKKPRQDRIASKEYSYTEKKVYIGLDVHKLSYFITVRCEGRIVKQTRMPASPEKLVKSLQKWFVGAEIFSAYEAGFSGFYLHRYLLENGVKNIVVHAAAIEVSSRDRVKTDKRDSLKIATQLEVGRLSGINVPTIDQEKRREVTRLREKLVRQRHKTGCQITSFFDRHQELGYEKKGMMSKKLMDTLEKIPLDPILKKVLQSLIVQWKFITKQIKELEAELTKQAAEEPLIHGIIQSTPGVGLLGARIIANELGDMKSFGSVKKLYSFTGLTPTEYSSGESRRQGHITRQGRSILRKILVQAAWIAIKKDKDLYHRYEEIAKRAGAKKAIIAIARKLVGRIRACLLKEENYLIVE